MIHSMTAFARTQSQSHFGFLACELRSVNHRYLEIRLHLPEALHALEQVMHDCIRAQVKRGKIECYFRFQAESATNNSLEINVSLAKKISEASQKIAPLFPGSMVVNPIDILQWPGVIQINEINLVDIQKEVMSVLEKAVQELMDTRLREGEKLKDLFFQRLDIIDKELATVKAHLPEILKAQRERLIKYFTDAKIEMDTQRLEQEMVMFAQKIDVAEEVDRLATHVAEVRRVIKQGGAIGRRLDFLMQELNREANTLGAKSVHTATTHASLEMKVLIEQMREQMQNVE